MIKVLHLFKTYYPDTFGGIEQVIYQLAEGSRAVGIKAEVLSLSPRGSFRDIPLAHHKAHSSKLDLYLASTGFSFSVIRDFKQLTKQADIVHYHFPWPFMDVLHFVTRMHKPSVLTYHSDIIKQKALLNLYKPLMNCFMGSVDHIVATSPNYFATSPFLKSYKEKISVIPIGLDCSSYPPAPPTRLQYWQNRLGERFFLFIGTLRYYKGLHILLDAMYGIDLPVVIAGAGPTENKLKDQAHQLGLRNVHFLGALSDEDKCSLLELCYGVVFPSHLRSEAFGITLLEGAMYAKPLISSEIGTGTTYINIHENTGLVVAPSDPVALRAAMLKLWHDPQQAKQYGQYALQRYQQLFTADSMVQQYAQLYQHLLTTRKKNSK